MLSDLAWLQPELTSAHRLPMHSVPHQDRMILDGTWPFQLLDHPDAEPTSTWRHIEVVGRQYLSRAQATRSYTWWSPFRTGRARIGPVSERRLTSGVCSASVRCGRSSL